MDTADELDIFGIIAFDGLTRNGLRLHPDGQHIVYPMGNKVTIKHMKTGVQQFLSGHRNLVSCVCVSPCGNFIASGQVNHHGFKVMVIIWDYEKREIKTNYEMHQARVEDVCFTKDGRYLISLGGRDDGRIVVWDVENGTPFCGTSVGKETSGQTISITRTNIDETCFVTAGEGTLKIWRIDLEARKVGAVDAKLGKIRRIINCVVVNDTDEYVYCGTTSGDVLKARLRVQKSTGISLTLIGCYSKITRPAKGKVDQGEVYAGGVKQLLLLQGERMIVGAGDGTVELVEIPPDTSIAESKTKKSLVMPRVVTHRSVNLCAAVTSMVACNNKFVLVATALSEIYEIQLSSFRMRLLITCHTSSVTDVAFPSNRSEVFATAGNNDIRVWKLTTQKELLRIAVPNFVCSSLCFDRESATIISAWNDGAIRAFAINGGNLVYAIYHAHVKPVSTVTITNDDCRLISGGCDGQVRIWNAKSETRQLLAVLKEHRCPITSLRVSPDNESFISSSIDGTCIIWNTRTLTRKVALKASTMFMATCFVPSGVQVLTCGTDRKIAYWETLDGSLVREIEGSTAGTLTAISISSDGRYFLTGSDDLIVKLWDYRTANTLRLGFAHGAPITACAFAPDGKFIITVSADGAIIVWKNPYSS